MSVTTNNYILLIFIISTMVGLFSTYSSPTMGLVNAQVCRSELAGVEWYTHYKENIPMTYSYSKGIQRHIDFIYGMENSSSRNYVFLDIPDHFDFQSKNRGYIIIMANIREAIDKYLQQSKKINSSDLKELEERYQLIKIYDNIGTDIWYLI